MGASAKHIGKPLPMGKGGFFCCFSDAALGADERPPAYSRAAQSGPYADKEHPYMVDFGGSQFRVAMKDALCHSWGSACCCLSTFFTCTYGTNWFVRRMVLDEDWSKYYCCQGFAPCGCNQCLDPLVPEHPNARACCMCCECLCCPGLAISASRIHVMYEYDLMVDPTDNQIIRFNNCMQCLACICDVLAICFRDLRGIARIIDCIADIVFFSVAGCMAGQLYTEKQYQRKLAAEGEANEPLMPPNYVVGEVVQQPPGQQPQAQPIAAQPIAQPPPVPPPPSNPNYQPPPNEQP